MRRLIVPIVGLCALGACSDNCTNSVITRADDPTGTRSAVIFNRDCGATTGFSTQISIIEKGEQLSGGGNTFRADDDHGAATVGAWGGPWAEMKWLAPDHLLIRYASNSRIFEQDHAVEIGRAPRRERV